MGVERGSRRPRRGLDIYRRTLRIPHSSLLAVHHRLAKVVRSISPVLGAAFAESAPGGISAALGVRVDRQGPG